MFTLDQIKTAHSKVKSGSDFPAYIREIKNFGVASYQSFVEDGHTDYYGLNHKVSSPAKYDWKSISRTSNTEQFKADLTAHQHGKTDYMTFCEDCAKSGVYRWEVDLNKMTCTYYDQSGNEILMENIPQ